MSVQSTAVNSRLAWLTANPVRAIWLLFGLVTFASYGLQLMWAVQMYFSRAFPFDVDRDFVNYWTAAKLTLSGNHMLAFDQPQFFEQAQNYFGPSRQIRSWSYPPHFLLLIWPLGFQSYGAALITFLSVTFLMFAAAFVALRRQFVPSATVSMSALGLFGYVAMMIAAMQNGFLTAALTIFVLAFMRSRPAIAGIALAVLTVKPQLGFLFPLLALMDRNWQLLRWATASTIALIGISIAIFGVESWQAYFTQVVPYQKYVMTSWHGSFLQMMPSVFGSLRTLEAPAAVAMYAQLPVSLFVLGYLVWLLKRLTDPLERAFAVLAATFLVTPYAFNYDMGALSAVAVLLAQRANSRHNLGAASILAVVAVLPGAMTNLGRIGVPIAPLVLAAGLFVIGRFAAANKPATAT